MYYDRRSQSASRFIKVYHFIIRITVQDKLYFAPFGALPAARRTADRHYAVHADFPYEYRAEPRKCESATRDGTRAVHNPPNRVKRLQEKDDQPAHRVAFGGTPARQRRRRRALTHSSRIGRANISANGGIISSIARSRKMRIPLAERLPKVVAARLSSKVGSARPPSVCAD